MKKDKKNSGNITESEPEETFWAFKTSLSSYECNMYATLKNLNTHEHTKCQNIYHFRILRQHFFCIFSNISGVLTDEFYEGPTRY